MAKPTIEEIRKCKEELVGNKGAGGFYGNLRRQQTEDQSYYDDDFNTSIKAPYHVIRTGTAKRICDAVTWHINTSNPQAFRRPRKPGKAEEEHAAKVTRYLNHRLFYLIDEIQEAAKKANKRGEAFFQLDPVEEPNSPPIITSPDPMIIYPDPQEQYGVPRRVIKHCYMTVSQIQQRFPNWSNPKNKDITKEVEYLAYWDKDWRYAEADGESLLKGEIQPNVLGQVPFSHCYSSYGEKSPEGKPETRAVGLLRPLRDRLKEECEIESRLDSIIGYIANPLLFGKAIAEVNEPDDFGKLDLSPGHNVWQPYGIEYEIKGMDAAYIQPVLYHLAEIKQSLGVELPPIAMGLPSTSRATGRQEDIYGEQYRRRFDKLIDNIERALATILGKELRYLYVVSNALPITIYTIEIEDGKQIQREEKLTREDIDKYYECEVRLKASDVIESDKQFTMYRMLMNEGHIDWETYLTEGVGWTQDKAKQVITNTLVEQMWKTSPQLMEIIMTDALEEAGRGDLLRKMEEQAAMRNQMNAALATAPPAQGQYRPTEATNQLAYGTVRQILDREQAGLRKSSAGYTQR